MAAYGSDGGFSINPTKGPDTLRAGMSAGARKCEVSPHDCAVFGLDFSSPLGFFPFIGGAGASLPSF